MSPALETETRFAVSKDFCQSNFPLFELYLKTFVCVTRPYFVTVVNAPTPLVKASSDSVFTLSWYPERPRSTVIVLFLAKSYTLTSAFPSTGDIARSSRLSPVKSLKRRFTPALYDPPKGLKDLIFFPAALTTITSEVFVVFSDGAITVTWPVFPPRFAVFASIAPLYPENGVMVFALDPIPIERVAIPALFFPAEICFVDFPRALPLVSV